MKNEPFNFNSASMRRGGHFGVRWQPSLGPSQGVVFGPSGAEVFDVAIRCPFVPGV